MISNAQDIVVLYENGEKYVKEGLPEKRFLSSINTTFQDLDVVAKKANLKAEEVQACLGILRRKGVIELRKEKNLQVKILPGGEKIIKEGLPEEKFLQKKFPLPFPEVKNDPIFQELMKRPAILNRETQKNITVDLTPLGKQLVQQNIEREVTNRLTPEMLKTGSWKKKQFRAFDIEINVPAVHGGKKHFVTQAIEYAKQIWIEIGFKEMTGDFVQTSFWNFDA